MLPAGAIPWLDFHYLLKDKLGTDKSLVIFDVGANVGQTALKFHGYFPQALIYYFEPVKQTFQELEMNVAGIDKIQVYDFAFGDDEREMQIFHRENSEWNSLVPELNEKEKAKGSAQEPISIKTLDTFIAANDIARVHFLKCDTEGYELQVLAGAANSLSQQVFDFIYLEVGFSNADVQHTHIGDLIAYLKPYGYEFSGLFEKAYTNETRIAFANALFTKVQNRH